MCADKDTCHRGLTQDFVETRPIASLLDGIDPDKHAVQAQDLLAHAFSVFVGVDDRFGHDAGRCEYLDHTVESACIRRDTHFRLRIAGPEDTNANVSIWLGRSTD